jgi:hypothetical protein
VAEEVFGDDYMLKLSHIPPYHHHQISREFYLGHLLRLLSRDLHSLFILR